jgi:hypothetical protein
MGGMEASIAVQQQIIVTRSPRLSDSALQLHTMFDERSIDRKQATRWLLLADSFSEEAAGIYHLEYLKRWMCTTTMLYALRK